VDGAPVAGLNSDAEVIAFLKDKIFATLPDKEKSPELYRLVESLQVHRSVSERFVGIAMTLN
jgi:hypothetical protein